MNILSIIIICISICILLLGIIYVKFIPIDIYQHILAAIRSKKPQIIYSDTFPTILHLMYLPWENATGRLKSNENDFDHTCYNTLVKNNPDYTIKLWTLSTIKKFTHEHYPRYADVWNKIKHPTQAVDFFRLLVVYHYGGIYWQYDSKQHISLDCLLPPEPKTIRLFVECILNRFYAKRVSDERIRKNKPEELIRIANQCYAAYPQNEFLKYCIEKSWNNLNTLEVKTQYDILYVGANAMISEAYDEYENKDKIELTYNQSKYISLSSHGSWRLASY